MGHTQRTLDRVSYSNFGRVGFESYSKPRRVARQIPQSFSYCFFGARRQSFVRTGKLFSPALILHGIEIGFSGIDPAGLCISGKKRHAEYTHSNNFFHDTPYLIIYDTQKYIKSGNIIINQRGVCQKRYKQMQIRIGLYAHGATATHCPVTVHKAHNASVFKLFSEILRRMRSFFQKVRSHILELFSPARRFISHSLFYVIKFVGSLVF